MCSHGRTLQRPRQTYYIYIYTEREREKGYREKERYRDKYCGRERIASYSCDHVTHYRGFVLHDCINMIQQTSLQCKIVSCLCFYSRAPMGGHSRDQVRHTIYIYKQMKRERKQREGEIQRQILREGKDYIIFLQSCNTLRRIYVT